jgi:hypothetical protein
VGLEDIILFLESPMISPWSPKMGSTIALKLLYGPLVVHFTTAMHWAPTSICQWSRPLKSHQKDSREHCTS